MGFTTSQIGLGLPDAVRVNFTPANGGVAAGIPTRLLAPVVITNGVSGAPDGDADLQFASKASFSVPVRVTSDHPLVPVTGVRPSSVVNNTIGVIAGTGTVVGDLMVAVPNPRRRRPTLCTVFRATGHWLA